MKSFCIRMPGSPEDLERVRRLFLDYQRELDLDLDFQSFASELAGLPGAYAPPRGGLYLAFGEDEPAGCIAFRPLAGSTCELKRLYVRPAARGHGLGQALASRAIGTAREAGYARIVLDTIPALESAIRLYTSLGFRDIEPYCFNPVPGARFFALSLADVV